MGGSHACDPFDVEIEQPTPSNVPIGRIYRSWKEEGQIDRIGATAVPVQSSFGCRVRFLSQVLRLLKLGVDATGFGELVFEDDDAASRVGAPCRWLRVRARGLRCAAGSGSSGDVRPQSVVGKQFRGIEATKESLPDTEDLGRMSHAVRRIVLVVESAGGVPRLVYLPEWLASFAERTGPPARGAPGAGWG